MSGNRELQGEAAFALLHTLIKSILLQKGSAIILPAELIKRAEHEFGLAIGEDDGKTKMILQLMQTGPKVQLPALSSKIWMPGQP